MQVTEGGHLRNTMEGTSSFTMVVMCGWWTAQNLGDGGWLVSGGSTVYVSGDQSQMEAVYIVWILDRKRCCTRKFMMGYARDTMMESFKTAQLLMEECIVPFRKTKSKHCGITIKPSQTPNLT
jgi:hypothetical protein